MKKKFINLAFIFIVSIFCVQGLQAQGNNRTTVGNEINSSVTDFLKTFADLEGTIFICGGGTDTKRKDLFARNMIEKTSRGSATSQSAYISFALPGEELPVPAYTFAMLNDKLYAFASTLGLKERTLYGCEIDKATLKLTGNPVKLFTFSVSAIKKQYFQSDFPEVRSSPGEEKLVFSIFEKNNTDNFGALHVKVFEHDLQPTWEKHLSGPTREGTFYIRELKIYDNGNVQVIGINKQSTESGKPREFSLINHIILYSDNGESILDREISVSQSSVCSVLAEILDNGRLIVSGSYMMNQNGEVKRTFGVYYMVFEPTETLPLFSVKNDISSDLVPDFMFQSIFINNGFQEWAAGTFMRSMFVKKDGSLILIGEHKSAKMGDDGLKELIVFGLNSLGKLLWTTQIFKSHAVTGFTADLVNSFKAFAYGENIIIFFNDNVANSLAKNDPQVEDFKGLGSQGMLVACTINPQGEITKQKVFQFEENNRVPCVKSMIQTGPDEFTSMGYHRKMKSNFNYTQMK